MDTHTLDFTYDASGTPISVTYDGTPYFYATNLQGDVLAILNSSGTAVVSYIYDAWGNHLSITGSLSGTLGYYNPLRYRGYVFDEEFGLYYLQSRYYNAGLGRFNAPDAFASTGQSILGNNMYAYCRNNPVIRKDASGTEDVCVENFNEDNTPINDVGNPSGSGGRSASGSPQSAGGTQKSVANGRITGYTKHGLNQAIAREGVGVKPSAILDTVRNPTKVISQSDGRIKYVGRQAVVVVNSDEKVITTYAKSSAYTRVHK